MPGDFESLTAEVEVKMASVEAPNRVMVSHLKRKFFEVGKYPVGLVAISRVKRQKDNRYTALAQVRIRNVTRNKTIEFELTQTNPYRVEGEVVLTLSEFNMPAGIIADEIPVRFGATLPMTRQ
jgi:polyisoprenoid-binding protein YceI